MIRSCVGRNEFRFIRWRSDIRMDALRVSDDMLFPNVSICKFTEDTLGEIQREVERLKKRRGENEMFSVRQKREIADKIQKILHETNHPELPKNEIRFCLNVLGAYHWSWARIKNNEAIDNPSTNPWNESQDSKKSVNPRNEDASRKAQEFKEIMELWGKAHGVKLQDR